MKYFYSHLVKIESLTVALDELELEDQHKDHLASLVDGTIHHAVLDLILSQLTEEDKKTFILMLHQNPDDYKLLEFLNSKVDKIEKQISVVVEKIKDDLCEDVKDAKRVKGEKKND